MTTVALDDDRERDSEAKRGVDGDHGGASGVDGVDDLGAVDALQVDRDDAEAGVPKLTLDHDERHSFASHLDGVRMP